MPEPFWIQLTEDSTSEMNALRAFDRTKVVQAMFTHLTHEPTKVSRSRIKKMDQPFWSQYRLRIEDFRVYYDVDEDTRRVTILRILKKGTEETAKESSYEAN